MKVNKSAFLALLGIGAIGLAMSGKKKTTAKQPVGVAVNPTTLGRGQRVEPPPTAVHLRPIKEGPPEQPYPSGEALEDSPPEEFPNLRRIAMQGESS